MRDRGRPGRVAVTGCGAVTPLGPDARALWCGLREGRRAIGVSSRLVDAPVTLAAEVEPGGFKDPKGWARQAVEEALRDAGLIWPLADARVAVGLSPGWRWPSAPPDLRGSRLGCELSELGLRGGSVCSLFTSFSACAAGLQLVEEAARLIRLGRVDVAVVVAFDSRVNRAAVEGYFRLGALAEPWPGDPAGSCRPFDRQRSGFVVGEGAGALVLESASRVLGRGAQPRGWLAGAASTCDAGSPVAPELSGAAAEACVRLALRRAGVEACALGYINTHGTGTPLNDRVEGEVLARVLGPAVDRVPCGSFKSMIGHLAMACGLVELVGCLPILVGAGIPANQNLEQPDAPTHLKGWEENRAPPNVILKTSFGFGGMNTAVILQSPLGMHNDDPV